MNTVKIVILDGYVENPGDLSWSGFEALGDVTVYDRTSFTDVDEIVGRIGDAEAVILNKTPLCEAVFSRCPNLKYAGVLATGFNVVDTAAARAHGVAVTNIPEYGTRAVGQYVFALLLEICHHVGHHDGAVHAGRWASSVDFSFWDTPLIELSGKTMGVVGFGKIGQVTARIAAAMGMQVVAYDKKPTDAGAQLAQYVSLDELYKRSDVISLHCPLTPETEGMVNRDSLAAMKDGVILINTSRGPVVNERDLADALSSGKVYAAGVDVVSSEPIKPDNPLLTAKNCVITPHIAWAPHAARARLMDIAVENLKAYLDGEPKNVVN